MQRTLITFIGTHRYSETLYHWDNYGEHRTAHVAAALGKLWRATGIVVLATRAAFEENHDRLQASLAEAALPPARFRTLPDGRSDQELWQQFQVMREAIEEAAAGEVLIDITHGFRAQPFFAGAVLSLLRAARDDLPEPTLVYGEYREKEPFSPVWDLTLFVELMDWAQALRLFVKTGVATDVVQLGRRIQRRQAKQAQAAGKSDWPSFGGLVKAIESFANDLTTIRVASIVTGYEQEDLRKDRARGSASALLQAIDEHRDEVAKKLPPLTLILDQLAENVRPLAAERLFGEDGQRALHALARYYLSLSRYPEAAVVTREARVSRYAENEGSVEVNSPSFDQEARLTLDGQFHCQDPNALEIAELRNDIQHGGFRRQPLSAQALRHRVEKLVQRLASAAGRTVFVSRHEGAAEWAARQGIAIDECISHLNLDRVHEGDTVIGTLPVHVAAEVCARGARYLHLSLNLPEGQRGVELTCEEMTRFGARLEEYEFKKIFR